jgi:hypothetical protein
MPLCTIFTRNGICWKMANKNTEESLVERLELGESLEEVVSDSLKAAASQAGRGADQTFSIGSFHGDFLRDRWLLGRGRGKGTY